MKRQLRNCDPHGGCGKAQSRSGCAGSCAPTGVCGVIWKRSPFLTSVRGGEGISCIRWTSSGPSKPPQLSPTFPSVLSIFTPDCGSSGNCTSEAGIHKWGSFAHQWCYLEAFGVGRTEAADLVLAQLPPGDAMTPVPNVCLSPPAKHVGFIAMATVLFSPRCPGMPSTVALTWSRSSPLTPRQALS